MSTLKNAESVNTEKITPLLIGVGKNIQDKRLKNEYFDIDGFMNRLLGHPVIEKKELTPVFVQGALIKDGNRKKENLKNIQLFCIDIDNGEAEPGEDGYLSYDDALVLAEKSGFRGAIYTTHSHSADKDKFRIVLPLAEAYALDAEDARDRWKHLYNAIMAHLGFQKYIDPTAERWSQPFYFPAHPKGAPSAFAPINHDGVLLDWRNFQDAATAAAIVALAEPDECQYTFGDLDLKTWIRIYGSTFKIVDALKEIKQDVIGAPADNGKAVCLQPCPFEEEHTSKNPRADRTIVYNPDGKGGGFRFKCLGGHCHNRDRLAYIEKMLIDGWLTTEALLNPEYGGGGLDAMEMAKECDEHSSPQRIKTILKVAALTGGATTMIPLKKELERRARWNKTDLNALAKENEQEETAASAKRRSKEKEDAVSRISPDLNREFAIVQMGNAVRIMREKNDSVAYLTKSDFNTLLENVMIPIGDSLVQVAPLWLTSPDRRQYDEVVFLPHAPGTKSPTKIGQYNLWRGYAVEPKQGNWSRLKRHILDNVCRGDAGHYEWFVGWLAQMVQQPQMKMGTSIVMKGKKGTGKSKVADWVRKMTGKHSFLASSAVHISGRFNGHLEDVLFLQAEEAVWGGDKEAEGAIKSLITADVIPIEHKNVTAGMKPNSTRLMFTSNEKWVVPATEDERRFFVLEVGDEQKQNGAYFAAIDAQMLNGGLEAMLFDLMRFDYSKLDLRNPPMTAALADQIEQGLETNARWLLDVLSDGAIPDDFSHTEFEKPLAHDQPTAIPTTNVYEHYLEFCRTHKRRADSVSLFGKFLASKGILKKRLGPKNSRVQKYVFSPLGAMRKAFTDEYGIQIGKTGDLSFRKAVGYALVVPAAGSVA